MLASGDANGGLLLVAFLAILFVLPVVISLIFDGPSIRHTAQAKRPIVLRAPWGVEETRAVVLAWIAEPDRKGRPKRALLESSPTRIRYQVATIIGQIDLSAEAGSTRLTVNAIPKLTRQAKLLYLIPAGPKRYDSVGDYLRSVRKLDEALHAPGSPAAAATTRVITPVVAPVPAPPVSVAPPSPTPAPPPAPAPAPAPSATPTGGLRSTMGRKPPGRSPQR